MSEYTVEADEGSSLIKETFDDLNSALEFAERVWLSGNYVAVLKDGALYCEYEV